jgi:ferredoxin
VFDASKCDRCGDCLVRCQYVDYTSEKAVNQITALIEGRYARILSKCITRMACNEYCQQDAATANKKDTSHRHRLAIPAAFLQP